MDKKKINFITLGQFGTFNHIYQIANVLISKKFDVSYFGVSEGAIPRELPTVKIYETKKFGAGQTTTKRIRTRLELIRLLYQNRTHLNSSNTTNIVTYFPGCAFLSLIISNLILDIRTYSVHPKRHLRIASNALLQFEALFFGKVTVLSKEMVKKLLYQRNVSVVTLGGPKFDFNEKSKSEMKALYVGTLKGRNILSLVKGFHLYLGENPATSSTLNIVARGDEVQSLAIQTYIEQNCLNEQIIFHGEVNFPEVARYYLVSNVGVSYVPITSYYDCQPPTKTYEYLLAGMYVLATDTAANRDVINSNNGLLIGESILDIKDGFLTAADRISDIEYADIHSDSVQYSWEEIVDKQFLPTLVKTRKKAT